MGRHRAAHPLRRKLEVLKDLASASRSAPELPGEKCQESERNQRGYTAEDLAPFAGAAVFAFVLRTDFRAESAGSRRERSRRSTSRRAAGLAFGADSVRGLACAVWRAVLALIALFRLGRPQFCSARLACSAMRKAFRSSSRLAFAFASRSRCLRDITRSSFFADGCRDGVGFTTAGRRWSAAGLPRWRSRRWGASASGALGASDGSMSQPASSSSAAASHAALSPDVAQVRAHPRRRERPTRSRCRRRCLRWCSLNGPRPRVRLY